MELNTNRPTRNPKVLWRKEGDGAVLMGKQDTVFVLNSTAATIWHHCTGQNAVADIVRLLSEEYEIDQETLVADVTRQLQFFLQEDLITL